MPNFEPIAIIAEGCVLPGADNPLTLWQQCTQGLDATSNATRERWGVAPESILSSASGFDRSVSLRGGFIDQFQLQFDIEQTALTTEQFSMALPGVQWLMQASYQALNQCCFSLPRQPRDDIGIILGNLSYAPKETSYLFADYWLSQNNSQRKADTFNESPFPWPHRFSSSAPVQWLSHAFNISGPAFCLDAACASSLYAIKTACHYLQSRRTNLMIAGAVNQADMLYLNVGFTALNALSRAGMARPFDERADGLVPAEGAAVVVLKRLSDALRDGDTIRGIIRGIGLSNDGREGGILSPSSAGQVRAMQSAYQQCDIKPQQVSYLECHATGTLVGDATELQSIQQVFNQLDELPVASLKSNLGHLITAAGAAGLVRVLQAMDHRQLAPSINAEQPINEFNSGNTRLVEKLESWDSNQNLIAGINAFGFGGNNAHMIVQHEWHQQNWPAANLIKNAGDANNNATCDPNNDDPFVICGLAIKTSFAGSSNALIDQLLGGLQTEPCTQFDSISVDLANLGFPPNDLENTIAQQLLVMEMIRELLSEAGEYNPQTTSVFVGMGVDMDVARYNMRTRLGEWLEAATSDQAWIQQVRDAIITGISTATSSKVLGTMPNMPANRSNHQLNLCGPSFTVSSEELSGVSALDVACQSIIDGDSDLAVVAAVDMAAENVHGEAINHLINTAPRQIDGAAVLLVQRKSQALKANRNIYAEIYRATQDSDKNTNTVSHQANLPQSELASVIGSAHAASGLMTIALGALMVNHNLRWADNKLLPGGWLASDKARRLSFTTQHSSIVPSTAKTSDRFSSPQEWFLTNRDEPKPLAFLERLFLFFAEDRDSLIEKLRTEKLQTVESQAFGEGSHRLAIWATSSVDFAAKKNKAIEFLENGSNPKAELLEKISNGIFYSPQKVEGKLGLVFTGAASAYAGMGQTLCAALPQVMQRTLHKHPILEKCLPWLDKVMPTPSSPFTVLQGCTLLTQFHAALTQEFLGIKPDAMLGVSSGETNSLFAADVWRDMEGLFNDIDQARMYEEWIAGDFKAAQHTWDDPSVNDWKMLRVLGSVEQLQSVVNDTPRVEITMINTSNDCVIAGERFAVEALLPKLERIARVVVPIGHDIIAHSEALKSWQQPWYDIHHRNIHLPSDRDATVPQFYSNAFGGPYSLSKSHIAKALTLQAVQPVDFRPVVNSAYADGVRIFIEQGPRSSCRDWINEILGDQPHLSVSFDSTGGGTRTFIDALAQLWAAGVDISTSALETLNCNKPWADQPSKTSKTLVAHPPPIELPKLPTEKSHTSATVSAPTTSHSSMPLAPDLLVVDHHNDATLYDSAANIEAINRLINAGPQPGYSFTSTETPVQTEAVFESTTATQTQMDSATQLPSSYSTSPAALMQRLHQAFDQQHQQYLAFQEQATKILMQASQQLATQSAPAASPQTTTALTHPTLQTPIREEATRPKIEASLPSSIESANSSSTTTHSAKTRFENYQQDQFPGPKFSREDLEHLSSGKISDLFGPLFIQQDEYSQQVRMPEPPLLLADRVLGIDATPGAMESRGSIWTETDVTEDAWYIHQGHMPAGIMIEAGQADLLLISWMGADFENRGERVYRLLGCQLTYRDKLPAIGDTLRYDIHVDGYAKQGNTRLFFFHYNCQINGHTHLEVRGGQAGFFTYQELADSSGVIWDPTQEQPRDDLDCIDAPNPTTKTHFDKSEVQSFSEGDLVTCFGENFFPANCHQRTPSIATGPLQMFDQVTCLDFNGGPWQRGYLKAEMHMPENHWCFDGHFKNDPCMPGTLMLEGGTQVFAFYLAALGFTLNRDGWRFEPIKNETFDLVCRSQLIPGAKNLTYELFVHGISCEPYPQLRADLLCTVDGRKAFLGRGIGVELVPGWPQESRLEFQPDVHTQEYNYANENEFAFDEGSMVACAWGKPSAAFGPHYLQHDGPRRGPRLPGYPYHFISRVTSVDIPPRQLKPGGKAIMQYDIIGNEWYFSENSQLAMPFPVLLEAALQPCGWLATYMGGGFAGNEEAFFRNLDGTATQHIEILPSHRCLTTEVINTSVSSMGPMTIVGFSVKTYADDELAYEMETVFGFFPAASLAAQAGLPTSEDEREIIAQPCDYLELLTHRPASYFNGSLRLPGPMLNLLDRITGFWPNDGATTLGRIRSEMHVDSNAWFFKSHFYGDPVQPGSLGLEMMLQTLQFFALKSELGHQYQNPRFESVASKLTHSWSYRGQVLPHNKTVICLLDINSIDRSTKETLLTASATLWVDGQKIYSADNLSVRVIEQTPVQAIAQRCIDTIFDCREDAWINDHCPTYTLPALPFTIFADLMVSTAEQRLPGRKIVGLRNVRVQQWVEFKSHRRALRTWGVAKSSRRISTHLLTWNDSKANYEEIASGDVLVSEQYPFPSKVLPPLRDGKPIGDSYAPGNLFHGPSFQGLIELHRSQAGASGWIDIKNIKVPQHSIHPGFIDACLHVIPHDNIALWFPEFSATHAAYPLLIENANFYSDTPTSGRFRVEARPCGLHSTLKLPRISLQIITVNHRLWADILLVEAVLPKGPLGDLDTHSREQFLVQRRYVDGIRLSQRDKQHYSLTSQTVAQSNWLPGTLQDLYDCRCNNIELLTRGILVKDAVAEQLHTHPSRVAWQATSNTSSENCEAQLDDRQYTYHTYCLDNLKQQHQITLQTISSLEKERHAAYQTTNIVALPSHAWLMRVMHYWRKILDTQNTLIEDFLLALVEKFTGDIVADSSAAAGIFSGPQAINESMKSPGVLYVANHQVGVESVLFSIVMSAFRQQKIFALGKKEHKDSWIGRLLHALFSQRSDDPNLLRLIDREDPTDILRVISESMSELASGKHSMLVHVAGTRALAAREKQETISSALLSAAVNAGVDIVPVKFYGALPLSPVTERLEFPVGLGTINWRLGEPISAAYLSKKHSKQQQNIVLDALNDLGDLLNNETPAAPDETFNQAVEQTIEKTGCSSTQAILKQALIGSSLPLSPSGKRLMSILDTKTVSHSEEDTYLEIIARDILGAKHAD